MRTEDQAPRHNWDDRLGFQHGTVEKIIHGIPEWTAIQSGDINGEVYRQAIAERLAIARDQVDELLWDFYSGDQLDKRLVHVIRLLRERGVLIGLLSNNTHDLVDQIGELGLVELFDGIVVSADIGIMKPLPHAYDIALNNLVVNASDAIFVDDFAANVAGARRVGMEAIHFSMYEQFLTELQVWLGYRLDVRPAVLIFDYGNVIEGPLDEDAFQSALNALAQENGFTTGQELWNFIYISSAWESAKRGQLSRDAFWQDRLDALGLHDTAEQVQFMGRLLAHRGIRPDMLALLKELKGKYRLAVLSNSARRDFARHLAEEHALGSLFDLVISSAEVGLAKPDRAIYELTLARLDVTPTQAVFIDDMERNVAAAEKLGIASIRFTSVADLRGEFARWGLT